MSNVTALKLDVIAATVEEAEKLLAAAKSGRLRSFVAFGESRMNDGGPAVTDYHGGEASVPSVMMAYESWKLKTLQNIVEEEPDS